MAVATGTRIGSYEVVALLGAGGMGEVYRARDLHLGREVALKFLPDSVAADEARLSRFEREAKLLASLNHPGVATLYGFEQLDGKPFLVLEVVEGPTLADRIQRGGVPWREASEIGRYIAEALEAAHEKGIVHRDLKPSNIKLSADGRIKLLDFGLGKALGATSVASEVKLSTETSPTDVGIILGTAPYMSPEQARGEPVDHRSDIWAFGCVLYEMLTGKRAFPGPSPSDVVVGILDREPGWAALPPDIPPPVVSLLRRCLTKDPFRRLHAIADARIELDEALAAVAVDRSPSGLRSRRWLVAVAMTLMVAAGSALAWRLARTHSLERRPPVRYNIALARGRELYFHPGIPHLALSADGRHLVYAVTKGPLYLHSFEAGEPRPLTGTDGATQPFFSPDGQWVGYAGGGKLQKVSVAGGAPIPITDVATMRGASWGDDGTIVYAPTPSAGLKRVSSEGGTPQKLTEPDGSVETSHRWPQMLPGGKSVLFTISAPSARVQEARIAVLTMETGQRKVLVTGGSYARYLPTGHLVYGSGGTLFAAPFDVQRLALTGPAIPVLEDVRMLGGVGGAQYAVSPTGLLAYAVPYPRPRETHLLWVDRTASGELVPPGPYGFDFPAISPDGDRLVVTSFEPDESSDLWMYDRRRQTWTRLTFGKNNHHAVWSPDGDRLAFASNREGVQNVFVMPSEGGAAIRLTKSAFAQYPTGWSPDGKVLFFCEQAPATGLDLWELTLDGSRAPKPVVVARGNQEGATLSPDGRWLAYASAEGMGFQVYVRPYPAEGRRWRVSTTEGWGPMWSRTGRELFFSSGTGGFLLPRSEKSKLWVAKVSLTPSFRSEPPRVLLERDKLVNGFDAAPDGRHFAVIEDADPLRERLEIVVIPNWFEELKAKVPVPR